MVVEPRLVQEFAFFIGHLLQAHTEIVFQIAEVALVALQLSLSIKCANEIKILYKLKYLIDRDFGTMPKCVKNA